MKDQPVFEKRMDDFLALHREEARRFSDHLGRNPETSGKEFESSRLFVEVLRKNGFSVEFPFLGLPTAFMARKISGGKAGGKVALLTEYDALPEIGHACGHNAHGTMSLYAGLALGQVVEETGGEVWVVGTPAEEEDGAKSAMSDQGVFDGVDLALMFHAFGRDSFTDYRSLALDGYDFTFKGKPAHAAATPWEGISALHGVQLFLAAQDMLRLHLRPEARLHAIITEGGAATNIIPESASCRVEFRAPKRPYLDKVAEAVFNCARGAALATGTEVSWQKFMLSFDDMLPNPTAESAMKDILAELGVTCSSGQDPRAPRTWATSPTGARLSSPSWRSPPSRCRSTPANSRRPPCRRRGMRRSSSAAGRWRGWGSGYWWTWNCGRPCTGISCPPARKARNRQEAQKRGGRILPPLNGFFQSRFYW